MERDGFTRKEVLKRIDSQMAIERKMLESDILIENGANLPDLERYIRTQVLEEISKFTPIPLPKVADNFQAETAPEGEEADAQGQATAAAPDQPLNKLIVI